uniref:Uncharacterized protein n=1 Tax=Dunaliella tertiolecta TaxID=3047 RepID=A0A7S3QQB5_DUNTE
MNGGGGAEFGSAMRSVLNEVAKEGSAAGAGPANMHTKMYASAVSNVPAPPPACAFTLFAPPALADLAAYTARPLYLIQREMEAHLDCPLPCSQLHIVFMPPAAMQALACGPQQAVSVGANIILASTEILVGPESVEGVMESCLALAGAMARQWFGVLMQPCGAEDAWVLEGLAAYLEDVFARAAMGQNDVAWRRHKEREAVAMADDGAMPPLYPHHTPAGGKDSGQDGGAGATAGVDQGATGAEDYGCTFGTEMLEPGPLRRWKAAAVVRMLEAKTGVDEFKRMLRTTVRRAMHSVGLTGNQDEVHHTEEKDEPATLQNPRLISTQAFLRLVKQYAGRKGLDAFAERWIYGRGCPRFTLGMKYSKHHNSLLFGMKQSGSAASQRSARAALAVGKVSKQGVDESLGHVKIHVQESHATSEAMIRVSPQDSYVFHEHYLACRPGMKKPGRKPKAETLAKAAREAEEANERLDADEQAGKHPVKFVRIDARCEWLCLSSVKQAENLWVNQLLHSKDVVAQAEAVTGLARLASNFDRPTQGVVSTLEACLKDRSIFSRVRAEVALVMGATADDTSDYAALPVLCKFFDDATRDPRTRQLRPNAFGDLSEYIVLRSLPRALARLRDGNFKSPPEVLDLLLGFLDQSDNTGNPYSDAHFTARFIEALGHLRLATPSQLADVLRLLDRHLALEDMLPSPNHVVGRACLTALAQLAASLGGWAERNRKAHEGARHTLRTYASPNVPLPLRQTAAQSLVLLESALALVDDKVKAVVSCTLELLQAPGWGASGLTSLMVGALEILGQLPPVEVPENAEGQDAFVFDGIPAQAALQLYNLMHTTTDARLRQCAFMLLMRATGEDPTLYREREEEEEEEEMEEVEEKEPEPSKPTQSMGTRTVDPRSQMIMGLGFRPGELEQFQEEQEREAAAKAGKLAPPQAQAEAAAAKEKVKLGNVAAMLRKRKQQRPGSPSHTGVSAYQTSTWGGGGSISRPAPTESTQLDSMEQQQEVEQPVQAGSAAAKAEQQLQAAAAAAEAQAKPASPEGGVGTAERMEVVDVVSTAAAVPAAGAGTLAKARKAAPAEERVLPAPATAHKPKAARSVSPPSAAAAGTVAAAAPGAPAARTTGAPTAGGLPRRHAPKHPSPLAPPARTDRHPSPLAPPARADAQPVSARASLSPPPSAAAAPAASGPPLRNGIPPQTGSIQAGHPTPAAQPLHVQKAASLQQQRQHQQQGAVQGVHGAHVTPVPASQGGPAVPKKGGAIKLRFGSKRTTEAAGAAASKPPAPMPSHAPSVPPHTLPPSTLHQPSTARAIPTLQQHPPQHTAVPTTSRAIPTLQPPSYHPPAAAAVPAQSRAIPTLQHPREAHARVQSLPSHAAPAAAAAAPGYQQQQLRYPQQALPQEPLAKQEEAEQPAPKKPRIKLKMKGHGDSQQAEPLAPAPAPAQAAAPPAAAPAAPGGTKIKFRFGKGGG